MAVPSFARWLGRQRVPTSQLTFRDLSGETRWLLGFAVLYVLASCLTGFLISRFRMPIWGATDFLQDVWYTVFFKVALLLVLPLVWFRRRSYRFADLLYGWRLTLRSAAVMVVCYALGVAINLGRMDEIKTAWAQHSTPEAVTRVALGCAIAFLQAGIPEEVVYRGMLQTRLEASWGRLPAILVSVALFVAWHIPTRYALAHGVEGEAGNLGSVLLGTGIPVGIVGLIFAWAWDRHRNLPALIAIHGGVDTLPIVASMLQSIPIGHR